MSRHGDGTRRRGGQDGRAPDRDPQRGQTVPLAALVVLGVTLALVVVVGVGRSADTAARARTAADAAALAGAADGCGAAAALADVNGARLVWCRPNGARIAVEVEVDGHRARADAEATVEWIGR